MIKEILTDSYHLNEFDKIEIATINQLVRAHNLELTNKLISTKSAQEVIESKNICTYCIRPAQCHHCEPRNGYKFFAGRRLRTDELL